MSLLARIAITEPYDNWVNMEAAAEQRYWDSLSLAMGDVGHETGCIYLLGYVAEMLLKTASFRTAGASPNDDLWAKGGPYAHLKTLANWTGRNLHDLTGWAYFLVDVRQALGKSMNPSIAGSLLFHVRLLSLHWKEDLRYRVAAATDAEFDEALSCVDWLRESYEDLWR